jgi:hypothetical protein
MKKSFVKMKMNAMKFAIPLFVALAYGPAQAQILGPELASFAVLAETSVTNVPTSTIVGNVGVSAGVSITGFGTTIPLTATSDPQVTGGLVHTTTGVAALAQGQLGDAILSLNGMANTGGSLLGNINGTYSPGVYDGGAGLLTGALTLDGSLNGAAPDVWVFRFASSLTTAESGSSVSVTNLDDGSSAGIYWVVGDFATLNGPSFAGNVLAQKTISSNGALTLSCGRLLSATADVTLIGDTISAGCFGIDTPGSGSGGFDQGNPTAPIPEPEIYAMMAVGLGLLGWVGRRKKLKEAAAA